MSVQSVLDFFNTNASAIQAITALITVLVLVGIGRWIVGLARAVRDGATGAAFDVKGKRVFISAPMSSLDSDPKHFRDQIIELMNCLRTVTGANPFSAYVAYYDDKAPAGYMSDPTPTMAKDIVAQLKRAEAFVLVYPEKIASSALVELGMALASGKRCAIFHGRDALPWLLKPEARLHNIGFNVNMFKIDQLSEVAFHVKTYGSGIFR